MHQDRGEDQLTEPQALKAWLRDVGGMAETFKAKVLNRKAGEHEERQHVWVSIGLERNKEEETRKSRTSCLKNTTKDYTSAHLQESASRVFAFASCPSCSESGMFQVPQSIPLVQSSKF